MKVTIRSFSTGALLKLGCIGVGAFWIAIGLFFGILALVGVFPVTVNNTPTSGIGGFLAGTVLGLVFAGFGALIFMLGGLLARLIPRIRDVEIDVKSSNIDGLES